VRVDQQFEVIGEMKLRKRSSLADRNADMGQLLIG
jgi:hypothetical protein